MRTVGVIQHLHAKIALLDYNQMTGAVQRNPTRTAELAIASALLADGPQVLPIAVPKNLDAIVTAVTDYKIAFHIKHHAAIAGTQLPGPAALAANVANADTVAQPENLNAAVAVPVMHDDVAVNVDGDAGGKAALAIAAA